ncbi:hypothetical protein HHK36_030512 [Tetracentron sinense]|uniref:DUF4219 domain-containing protein n=1 Tax=Tetracentron sinense TaxID=13715 RepID=A0A834YCZ2_TETSI|nr:hypothetical protein HHK36_030512 [Tetracentron sinense]
MASGSNTNTNVQQPPFLIFDGDNYDIWCVKMKTLFLSYDIWEFVEEGYEEPENVETLSNARKQQLKETKRKDAKALHLIQQGVADPIFPRIINATTSKEAWDILQKEYRGTLKKFGHLQKDCRIKNNQQANFSEEQESDRNMFYACQASSEKRNDVWYLDSGCSNHMTGDQSIFVNMNTFSNSQVRMGNGVLVQAKGKGTIAIETKKGTKYIQDVLLVPDLEQNLLSVGQLVEHGYSIHFEENSCKIYDKGGRKTRLKFDDNSEKCIFVGYSSKSKGYRFYSLKKNKVIICRDVLFNEKASWNWKEKNVQNQVIAISEEQECFENEDEDEAPPQASPIASSPSSPTSPSSSSSSLPRSTPRRMKNLSDVYASLEDDEIQLKYCKTDDQVADIFTKALPKDNYYCINPVSSKGEADYSLYTAPRENVTSLYTAQMENDFVSGSVRNMAFSKASHVMVMAIFVATLFLWSFEVATAGFQEAIPIPEWKLGRRVLGVPIDKDYAGQPGYIPYYPRGGVGRGGFSSQPYPTYPPP